ncbi:AarF/ABC1/UbiB kinase family protein [uncultured Pseudokineococcus sp.]|uniref:ABC1 kinase family protein n=1 Tax=uncultured Pseudokineococcus sp. TaxID=1642928 RepID=UPI002614D85A|nr:AarF/ABC1/UbiB kinase family protein [uncultured Pseudokineococcus sp.]
MDELPRRALQRGVRLASLPAGFAGRTAVGLGKRLGGRPAEAVAAEMQARTAEQLFTVLGQLKGGAMKVGQAMSIFEAALPEEVAAPYRATLTRLQDSAPPMPAATVHGVLARELGPGWRERFAAFDDEPVAAASIGQVHRGTWQDGRPVAVKIQYPGAAQALVADITQVSRVARLTGSWLPGLDLGPVLAELKERLVEELDYTVEAASQRTFADAFRDDPDFAVPEVLESTEKVIVSEWLDGEPLSTVIREGSQDERDLASRRYLEFLLLGPAETGLLHADPHPGNFRLTRDGRFGILDFGAVKRLPDGMPPAVGRLLGVALSDDPDGVVAGLREEGFIKPSIELDGRALLDYVSTFLRPLDTELFTFDRAWLRELFAEVRDPRTTAWAVGLKLNLPREYVLIHRVWLGGLGVLCQLGGTVPCIEVLEDHLPGFADS